MRFFCAALTGAMLFLAPAWGQNAGGGMSYNLRPPPLTAPAGAPGAVRRAIMQFYQWTLICDTVFADNTQVCNVSQALWSADNKMVFSWSLVASDKGVPFMLLRTPPNTDTKTPIRLALKDHPQQAVEIAFVGCNNDVCVAQTPVGPFLTQAIKNRNLMTIAYRLTGQGLFSFDTSFLGLREAVAAIK